MRSTKKFAVIIILIACLAMLLAYSLAKQNAEEKLKTSLKTQLSQVVNELTITLERHSYLPSLLASDDKIIAFLKTEKSNDFGFYSKREKTINASLEFTNNISGTASIFLMDTKGKVISASNWGEVNSFTSQNMSSWPFFKQARQNALGRYFSSQSKSGERYYFFAQSVQQNNLLLGVIAVQVPLSDIALNWILADIDFIVTDNNGVIFLSSKKPWELKAISKTDKNITETNIRYHNEEITSLNKKSIDISQEGFQKVSLLDEKYQMLSHRMELANWNVRALSKYSIAEREITRNIGITSILVLLTTLLALLLLTFQNQKNKFRQQTQEELEQKVVKRTEALKRSQEDLIQAAKMAALGQLSTGITHEINNPLSAIRAYAENASQFLQKDRLDMADQNLKEITKLTENMAAITSQLKSFARKSKGQLKPVNLDTAINNAISIVNPKIVSSGTNIKYNNPMSKTKSMVLADEVWLSQVLLNLVSNAISATNQNIDRNVWVDVVEKHENNKLLYCVEVRDNGTGIEENNLPKIFEPFFTTKPTTKGLGLGLSISFNLVKDMNGTLDARNRESGGALFTLCLLSAYN